MDLVDPGHIRHPEWVLLDDSRVGLPGRSQAYDGWLHEAPLDVSGLTTRDKRAWFVYVLDTFAALRTADERSTWPVPDTIPLRKRFNWARAHTIAHMRADGSLHLDYDSHMCFACKLHFRAGARFTDMGSCLRRTWSPAFARHILLSVIVAESIDAPFPSAAPDEDTLSIVPVVSCIRVRQSAEATAVTEAVLAQQAVNVAELLAS